MITSALVAIALASTAYSDEPFKAYVNCAAATRDCSSGKASFARAGVVDLAILFASRGGQDGFYLFAPEDAYFHAFPPAPAQVESKGPPPPSFWNLYGVITKFLRKEPPKANPYLHYKLEAGLHEVVYATFKRQPDGTIMLESATTTPRPGVAEFLPGSGGECHADAESRALIVQEAAARVASVNATYLTSPEPDKNDVMNEVNITGHDAVRHYFNRESCLKALDACMDAEDLKRLATAEREKFGGK